MAAHTGHSTVKELQAKIAEISAGAVTPTYHQIWHLARNGVIPHIPRTDVQRVRFRTDMLAEIAGTAIRWFERGAAK
jgi:hypothetical protein